MYRSWVATIPTQIERVGKLEIFDDQIALLGISTRLHVDSLTRANEKILARLYGEHKRKVLLQRRNQNHQLCIVERT